MDDLEHAAAAGELFRKEGATSPLFSFYEPLCDLRLASGQAQHARALEISTRVLDPLGEFHLGASVPEALCYKGMAERGLGRIDAARASLRQARAGGQGPWARWQSWEILGALGGVELDCGNRAEAKRCFEEGRAMVAYIAEHAPSELRVAFLELPRVKNWEGLYVEP